MSRFAVRDQRSMVVASGPGNPKYSPQNSMGTLRVSAETTSMWPPAADTATSARRRLVWATCGRSSGRNSDCITALSRALTVVESRESMNGPTQASIFGAYSRTLKSASRDRTSRTSANLVTMTGPGVLRMGRDRRSSAKNSFGDSPIQRCTRSTLSVGSVASNSAKNLIPNPLPQRLGHSP